ncbi:MAG: serine/threonine-protein kinase, partial [Planctomycetia bacterium]|nr:serine/threonine-protein kinase [Planctomycetia bacterium]
MAEPDEFEQPSSKDQPSSGTAEVPGADAAADSNENTFLQKTLSEVGNEGLELSASRPGAISIGSQLGPYQIVRKIGQGGMGAVYEARHIKLKKSVAIKILPPEMTKSPTLVARFEREMEAVGALDHPHIVRAMDAGEFNGTHFLVMEYVEGTDLSQWVKEQGPLSIATACRAMQQAALGLEHAHEHGLVHRDIKPSNLLACTPKQARRASEGLPPTNDDNHALVGRTGLESCTIKILDLGLARLAEHDDASAGLTSSGQVLGTPDYMAPEQWDDTHTVDGRADLYSLGCTLFYVLTGKAPYASNKPRSMLHIMKAHVDGAIPDLTERCPQVPAELNALYQRLLAKKLEDRFQTA